MDKIVRYVSGEFLLDKRPNGGGIIVVRSFLVSVWFYLAAVGLRSITEPGAEFVFSCAELKEVVNDTIPWFGAIFAAAYAAFYARYSNHCGYLASLYNQIMSVKAALGENAYSGNNRALINWQVGFIVDAREMHLANKELFRGVVMSILDLPEVRSEFLKSFEGSKEKQHEQYSAFCKLIRRKEDLNAVSDQEKATGSTGHQEAVSNEPRGGSGASSGR